MGKESKEDDFSFDDFVFGDVAEEAVEEVKEEVKEEVEEKEEEIKQSESEVEDDTEEESEEETEEEEELEQEDEDESEESEDSEGFASMIELVHEHNGWDFNADDFKESDSVEGLMDFVKDIVSANSKPEFASDEVQKFNEFVSKYGADKAGEFLEVNHGSTDYETVDLEDEGNMKTLMSEYLKKTTKFSDAKIERQVKKAEELGELEEDLDEMKEFMVESKKDEAKKFEDNEAKAKQDASDREAHYLSSQRDRINSTEEIAGFKLAKKDKDGLFKFAYEVGRDGKTAYQRLRESDKDTDLKLLMHAYKGLDKKKISKFADSDAAKKLKKDLSRHRDSSAKPVSKAGAPRKNNKKKSEGTDYNAFLM